MSESNKLDEIGAAVEHFSHLDTLCERIKGKGICDALGVQCNSSCNLYTQKDEVLKALDGFVRRQPPSASDQTVTPSVEDRPTAIDGCCPSCGQKPARDQAKYCDYCGEEL